MSDMPFYKITYQGSCLVTETRSWGNIWNKIQAKNVLLLIYNSFAEALSWLVNKCGFLAQVFLLSQKKMLIQ